MLHLESAFTKFEARFPKQQVVTGKLYDYVHGVH
jgi:hypothetical protein